MIFGYEESMVCLRAWGLTGLLGSTLSLVPTGPLGQPWHSPSREQHPLTPGAPRGRAESVHSTAGTQMLSKPFARAFSCQISQVVCRPLLWGSCFPRSPGEQGPL